MRSNDSRARFAETRRNNDEQRSFERISSTGSSLSRIRAGLRRDHYRDPVVNARDNPASSRLIDRSADYRIIAIGKAPTKRQLHRVYGYHASAMRSVGSRRTLRASLAPAELPMIN